jgi:hypothetical protein
VNARAVLILLLAMTACLRAETRLEKLQVLGGSWLLQKDGTSLELCPFEDTRLWLNGRRLPTHDEQSFIVHAGDRVDSWNDSRCYRFHFESISTGEVVVDLSTFVSVRQDLGGNRNALKSGRLLEHEVMRIPASELPAMLWDNIQFVERAPPGIHNSKR